MFPKVDIVRWRAVAPWADDDDVEQDLAITLALFDIFRDEELKAALAFRGGTALHKLHLPPAARYSEDIDLVQRGPGPIGPTLSRLRRVGGGHLALLAAYASGDPDAPISTSRSERTP